MSKQSYITVILCLLCSSCYKVRSTVHLDDSRVKDLFPELFAPEINHDAIVERFGPGDNSVSPRVHSWILNRIDQGIPQKGSHRLKGKSRQLAREYVYERITAYPYINPQYLALPKEKRSYGPKYELIIKLDAGDNIVEWNMICLR